MFSVPDGMSFSFFRLFRVDFPLFRRDTPLRHRPFAKQPGDSSRKSEKGGRVPQVGVGIHGYGDALHALEGVVICSAPEGGETKSDARTHG